MYILYPSSGLDTEKIRLPGVSTITNCSSTEEINFFSKSDCFSAYQILERSYGHYNLKCFAFNKQYINSGWLLFFSNRFILNSPTGENFLENRCRGEISFQETGEERRKGVIC